MYNHNTSTLFIFEVPDKVKRKLTHHYRCSILVHSKLVGRSISLYTGQVVAAVEYLHSNRYSHRDIKPSNVLVSTLDGLCKLTDFGTLKDVTGLEKTTTEDVGSLAYKDKAVVDMVPYGQEVVDRHLFPG